MGQHSGGDKGSTSVSMLTNGGVGLVTRTQTAPASPAQSESYSLSVSAASSADPATVFIAGGDMAGSNNKEPAHQSGSGLPQRVQAGLPRSGVSPLSAAEPKPSLVQRRTPVAAPRGPESGVPALPSLRRAASMPDVTVEAALSPLPEQHFGLGAHAAALAALRPRCT